MELTQDRGNGNYIDSYEADAFEVDKTRYESSLIIAPHRPVELWRPSCLADLTATDLASLIALKPKILIFGSGKIFNFPSAELLAPFYAAEIGIEVMDTAAACRTYNILMTEERAVVAALLLK
jgi:uncharacterized protein